MQIIFSYYVIMNNQEAEELSLGEMCRRLNTLPVRRVHDPLCECRRSTNCHKTVESVTPTEYCLQPMKDFEIASSEIFRKMLKEKIKYNSAKKKAPKTWCFVTVSAKPSVTLEQFKKKFLQFLKTKLFADYLGVLEQKGTLDNKLGTGIHCHILFKRHTPLAKGLPPTNIDRNVRDAWKNLCDSSNKSICNIQFVDETFALDKIDYMLGLKTGTAKDGTPKEIKQKADIVWRQQNGISDYYGNKNIM